MKPERKRGLARELAIDFARHRTHGDVSMDGRHNPLPSEVKESERFMDMVERVLDMTDEQFAETETRMGYEVNT